MTEDSGRYVVALHEALKKYRAVALSCRCAADQAQQTAGTGSRAPDWAAHDAASIYATTIEKTLFDLAILLGENPTEAEVDEGILSLENRVKDLRVDIPSPLRDALGIARELLKSRSS